jgi:hypothetical protein
VLEGIQEDVAEIKDPDSQQPEPELQHGVGQCYRILSPCAVRAGVVEALQVEVASTAHGAARVRFEGGWISSEAADGTPLMKLLQRAEAEVRAAGLPPAHGHGASPLRRASRWLMHVSVSIIHRNPNPAARA